MFFLEDNFQILQFNINFHLFRTVVKKYWCDTKLFGSIRNAYI